MRCYNDNLYRNYIGEISQGFYNWIGNLNAKHPKRIIFLSIALALTLGTGTLRMYTERDAMKLWSPQNSRSTKEESIIKDAFGPYFPLRRSSIILEVNNNVQRNKEALLTLVDISEIGETTYVEIIDDGTKRDITLNDVCVTQVVNSEEVCAMNSVLDLFWNATHIDDDEGNFNISLFLRNVRATINAMSDDEIDAILSQGDYINSWNGSSFSKSYYFMNIDDGDTYLAVRGTYNMIGKSIEKNEIDFLYEWENEWERNLFDNDLSTSKNFKLYMQSNNDLNEGLSSAVSSDMGLILVGVFLSIIYLSIAIGMACDTVQSRVLLGLAAISSIILAIISTYGVGSLLTFYGPVHQALPLLMIAIGVDDAFVIVSSYDQHEVVNHDDKRFTEALHSAGSAIAFTSVTNACGYLVASVTEIAALRNFTVWAAIGIFFDFFYQITFFTACFYLDIQRQKDNRIDICPCILSRKKTARTGHEVVSNEQEIGCLDKSFKMLSSTLVKAPFRRLLLLIIFTLLVFCAFGASKLNIKFDTTLLLPDGSRYKEFDNVLSKYYPEYDSDPLVIFTGDINYSNESVQQRLSDLFHPTNGIVSTNKHYVSDSMRSWYWAFREFEGLRDGDVLAENIFYDRLKIFLESDVGSTYNDDLEYNENLLIGTLSYITAQFPHDINRRVDFMISIQKSCDGSGLLDTFAFTKTFQFYDGIRIIKRETIKSLALSCFTIFLIAAFWIGNISIAAIVIFSVILSLIDLLGFVQLFGIGLNTVSVVCLTLGIGMAIDFSAHIALAFINDSGNANERVMNALRRLGPALTHASLSTFLVIFPLSIAKGYVLFVFFTMFSLIICIGVFHGTIFVPIMLSLQNSKTQQNSSDTDSKKIAQSIYVQNSDEDAPIQMPVEQDEDPP